MSEEQIVVIKKEDVRDINEIIEDGGWKVKMIVPFSQFVAVTNNSFDKTGNYGAYVVLEK